MNVDLTISQILTIIGSSNNPEYITAILEGKENEHITKYPKVGQVMSHPKGYDCTITEIDLINDRIRYKYLSGKYYENSDFIGFNSRDKSDTYQYYKIDAEYSTNYESLKGFNSVFNG